MISKVASLLLYTFGAHLVGSETACLNYVTCYDDMFLDPYTFTIYHPNAEERSAVSCASICLQRRRETRLVLAKLVDVSERLICGCADGPLLDLSNRSAILNDYYNCFLCPDADNQKCGSEKTSSVYEIDYTNHSCPRVYLTVPEEVNLTTSTASSSVTTVPLLPSITSTPDTTTNHTTAPPAIRTPGSPPLDLLGCFPEDHVNNSAVVTMFLQWPGVNVTHCARNCTATYPDSDLFLVKLLNTHRLYCGCG